MDKDRDMRQTPEEENREYYTDPESGLTCFEENGLTFVGEPKSGLFYPTLCFTEPQHALKKWGTMRRNYIRDHKPRLWGVLKIKMDLHSHCYEVEQEALEMHERLLTERMKPYRYLQTEDYMEYLRTLNNMTNQVDEIVSNELIYV